MASRYETQVDASTPNNAHGIALQLVGSDRKVLELGASAGHVTRALIARGNHVWAVENDPTLESDLRNVTPNVVIADLDNLDLLDRLDGETFDVVLAGDVLEHTIHGPLILEQIRQLLRPGGFLVVSLPNISHGDVRLALLNGDFAYRDTGLLDRTHRVFYTRESARDLLALSGFTDLEVFASTTPIGTTEIQPNLESLPQSAIHFVQQDPESAVYQYIIRARPKEIFVASLGEGQPMVNQVDKSQDQSRSNDVLLRSQSETLYGLNRQLLNENKKLFAELADLKEETRIARGVMEFEMRDHYLGILAELGEARARLLLVAEQSSESNQKLANEMTRAYEAEKKVLVLERERAALLILRNELNLVYKSTTWKIGRFVMLPVRAVKRLFR
jgi:2-polyprenyl-3-methyl-5-hydroxy-6-metoxy-1,4-benzoquinol methylase